jgi:hypothetical protein
LWYHRNGDDGSVRAFFSPPVLPNAVRRNAGNVLIANEHDLRTLIRQWTLDHVQESLER